MSNYSDLYGMLRTAIGDRGIYDSTGTVVTNSNDFQDTQIDSAIDLALLDFTTYSGASQAISPTIANDNDKGAIVYYAALLLALPEGPYALDTPNMRLRISANKELIWWLLGRLHQFINAGGVRPKIWGALDQLRNEGVMVADREAEAIGAY